MIEKTIWIIPHLHCSPIIVSGDPKKVQEKVEKLKQEIDKLGLASFMQFTNKKDFENSHEFKDMKILFGSQMPTRIFVEKQYDYSKLY